MINLAPRTFIFVALPCEAKPLIRAWRLKKPPGKQAFAIYQNNDTVLVVSGLGKIAMAGAVAYTMAQFSDAQQPILLNLGIAGHPHQPIGCCLLADMIIDAESGRRFYPQLPFKPPCPTSALKTFTKVNTGYAEDCLYDMEASAFYEIASRFSTNELIHCCKVVSDNSSSPLENICETSVDTWIGAQLHVLDRLVANLVELKQLLPTPDCELHRQLLSQFHFTTSNAIKLQGLLNRWKLVKTDRTLTALAGANITNARELLTWLEEQVAMEMFRL